MTDKNQSRLKLILASVAVLLVTTACRNPFVGMGQRVDLNPPDGDVTNFVPGNYIRGDFTLEGTVTDDTGVASVYMMLDGDRLEGVVTGETWAIDIPTYNYDDGEWDVTVFFTDSSGKPTEERLLLIIDNSPPILIIDVPRGYSTIDYTDYVFDVKGEAYDGPYGRVQRVEARVLDPIDPLLDQDPAIASFDTPVGTSSWTTVFHNNGGAKTHNIEITAWDYAGNTSTHMYHFDDLLAANGGTTAVDILNLFTLVKGTDETIPDLNITRTQASSIEISNLDGLPLSVDMTGDEPDITVLNPAEGAAAVDNIMVPNGTIVVTLEDDNSIDLSTIQIRFDTDTPGTWRDVDVDLDGGPDGEIVTTTSFPYELVRFTYPLDSLTTGVHTLQVRVSDQKTDGSPVATKTGDIVDFTIDSGAPQVSILTPAIGDYLNAAGFDDSDPLVADVSGTASADAKNIEFVRITLDDGVHWVDATTSGLSDSVTWTFDIADWKTAILPATLTDGQITITARAITEGDGKYSDDRLQITYDTEAPTAFIYSPALDAYVNGDVELRVQASDNTRIQSVEYVVGDDEVDNASLWPGTAVTSDLYQFTIDMNSRDFDNDVHGTVVGDPLHSDIWRVPVRLRIYDVAGNVFETDQTTVVTDPDSGDTLFPYFVQVNNALDLPSVYINSPSDGDSYGGVVRVAGSSFDDDGEVMRIEVRADLNTHDPADPNFSDSIDLSLQDAGYYIDFNSDAVMDDAGALNEQIIDENEWHTVSGTNNWWFNINTFGEVYDTDDAGVHDGEINLEIRAVDRWGVTGIPQSISFRVDDSIPLITGLNYSSNDYVGGTIILEAEILDDEDLQEIWLTYYTSGGSPTVLRLDSLPASTTHDGPYDHDADPLTPPYDLWTLHHSLNTLIDIPTSGSLQMELKAVDDTNYQTVIPLTLLVDNIPPTETGTLGYTGNTTALSGSDAKIQGEVFDLGAVYGIEKVEVYLVRDDEAYDPTHFYNFTEADPETDGDSTTGNYPMSLVVFDSGELNGSDEALYPDTIITHNLPMIINNPIEQWLEPGGNADGDGFAENLASGSPNEWGIEFNSLNIPDGPVDVHYVFYDHAENTTHHVESVFIANNAPSITGLQVGTDLNDDNDNADPTETETYGGAGTFMVRNNHFAVIPTISGGNGSLSYRLYHGSDATGTLVSSSNPALITDFTGISDGTDVNFFLVVEDQAGLTAEMPIVVDLENTDDESPVMGMETLIQSDVVNGHLEEAGGNVTYQYNGADADVSGQITLRGTASDNQRIQEIRMSISGDAEITDMIVAQWSGGTLVEQNGFSIDSQSLTENDIGPDHQIEWSYLWSTTGVDTIVANNVDVSFEIADFNEYHVTTNPTGNAVGTASKQVDVVPYISSVTTFLSSAYASNPSVYNRASSGEYPVFDVNLTGSNLIDIIGYNLGSGVTASIGGVDLTVSLPTMTSCTIDLESDSPVSGELILTVAGIDSRNNTNDNGSTQNQEPNGLNNNLLTDDRYIDIWAANTVGSTTAARFPVMKIWEDPLGPANKVGFSFANGETFASVSDDGVIRNQEESYTRYNYTTFDYDDQGNYYSVALNSDRVDDVTSSKAVFFSRNHAPTTWGWPYTLSWHYRTGTGKRQFEHNYNGTFFNSLRTQNPDMVATGDDTGSQHYLSYYDASMDVIKFRYFTVGANSNTIAGDMRNWEDDVNNWSATGDQTVAASGESGTYSAVAVVPTGAPGAGTALVAWYDASSQNLMLAWDADPSSGSDVWDVADRREIDDFYAGQHVEMFVDGDGGVHLAYYTSASGDLKYAYLEDYTDLLTAPQVFTVDSYLSVGTNLDIVAIDNGTDYIPHISYSLSAYKDTSMSLRMAYLDSAIKTSGVFLDAYTGGWAISTIPVTSVPKDYKISIGELDGEPVIGFASSLGLQWVTQVK